MVRAGLRRLNALDRHTDALLLGERALAICEAALGPDHPDTALCLNNLAALRRRLADDDASG
ncbi:tetratricopeptide repeat protein [Streptomyces sp. NBS 14/10]|uniref:tetratricopeptide repeat protein n=1 Tax=Streptomyces sp. NBS 14/10 TaxID=1945643 RepID=UPI000B7E4114|nr:tetratricopeptide repeat protein [Streptomyces sp. NBS 14/10]KAK1186274.1 tetratricopeptide repeat protein [Streptomyces sp. NBS 14/10]